MVSNDQVKYVEYKTGHARNFVCWIGGARSLLKLVMESMLVQVSLTNLVNPIVMLLSHPFHSSCFHTY